MRTKVVLTVMLLVVVFYAGLIGFKGIALLGSGSVVGVLLGLALLVLPVLGLLLVWREVEFGRRTAELGRALDAEGGLPLDDLPRRPSGRVDRAAADAAFEQMRIEAESSPEDWRVWYRLALAYDAAGDRTRARAAARHAIAVRG
jgi:cytochrome c-type biogenesis protein CcmH/NrfG